MKSRKLNQNNHQKQNDIKSTSQSLRAEQVVEKFELPKDLFLGMPLLSMEGNRSLCITNHRGIVKYSQETIIVAARAYGVEITGRSLTIPRFTKELVEITGYMESVTFRV